MTEGIFEYLDYKKYLNEWIDHRARDGRGERSRIATSLRCNIAYISRILNGDAHLSLEQAHMLNSYAGHSNEEADFFLLLVLYARAGTKELQNYYMGKLRSEIERKSILKNRLDYRKSLTEVDQSVYFSAWYYAAIHLLLAIPELQTKDSLVKYLKVSAKHVTRVLDFLVHSGLAIEKRGRFQTGPTNIHLGNDSEMIFKHHANWRLQALQSLERDKPEELHYSSVITIPEKHVPRIRSLLIKAIEQVRELTKGPQEEVLFCYNIDFFEVGNRA